MAEITKNVALVATLDISDVKRKMKEVTDLMSGAAGISTKTIGKKAVSEEKARGREAAKQTRTRETQTRKLGRLFTKVEREREAASKHDYNLGMSREYNSFKMIKLWQTELGKYRGATHGVRLQRLRQLEMQESRAHMRAIGMAKQYRYTWKAAIGERRKAATMQAAQKAFMPDATWAQKWAWNGIEMAKSFVGGFTKVARVGLIMAISGIMTSLVATAGAMGIAGMVFAKMGKSVLTATDSFTKLKIVLAGLYGDVKASSIWDEMFKKSMKYQANIKQIIQATIEARRLGAPFGFDIQTKIGPGVENVLDLIARISAESPSRGFEAATRAVLFMGATGNWDRLRRSFGVAAEAVSKVTGTPLEGPKGLYRAGTDPMVRLKALSRYLQLTHKGSDMLEQMSNTLTVALSNLAGAWENLLFEIGEKGAYRKVSDFFNFIKDKVVGFTKSTAFGKFGQWMSDAIAKPFGRLKPIIGTFFDMLSIGDYSGAVNKAVPSLIKALSGMLGDAMDEMAKKWDEIGGAALVGNIVDKIASGLESNAPRFKKVWKTVLMDTLDATMLNKEFLSKVGGSIEKNLGLNLKSGLASGLTAATLTFIATGSLKAAKVVGLGVGVLGATTGEPPTGSGFVGEITKLKRYQEYTKNMQRNLKGMMPFFGVEKISAKWQQERANAQKKINKLVKDFLKMHKEDIAVLKTAAGELDKYKGIQKQILEYVKQINEEEKKGLGIQDEKKEKLVEALKVRKDILFEWKEPDVPLSKLGITMSAAALAKTHPHARIPPKPGLAHIGQRRATWEEYWERSQQEAPGVTREQAWKEYFNTPPTEGEQERNVVAGEIFKENITDPLKEAFTESVTIKALTFALENLTSVISETVRVGGISAEYDNAMKAYKTLSAE